MRCLLKSCTLPLLIPASHLPGLPVSSTPGLGHHYLFPQISIAKTEQDSVGTLQNAT